MPPSPSTRIIDHDGTFFSGVKSDQDPSQIPLGTSWMAVNMVNIGGSWSCRPGYRCVLTLPDGNLQGGFIFRPDEGLEQAVVAIDGKIMVADWPFTNFRTLENVQLSPYARQVFWVLAVQGATRIAADGISPGVGPAPAIKAIPPKTILFAQDGGLSAPAWYDGANSGQVSGDLYGTPAGADMAWVGDRLWIASDHQVFASDISNPFSFRETGYLGGQVSLFFRSRVTAMVVTPSTESPQLMVFTEVNGSIVQANIRDRALWTTTPNFQEEVIGVGCLSSKSCVSHYGRLIWFSPTGVNFYDPALSGKITTRLPVRDNEMLVSKAVLSDDLSQVAAGIYGQWLLMSVPAEDTYNRHTWVLNHASLTTLSDDSGPSWSGYWIGTRPVEWMYGQVANTERIFHVSVDFDGKNRLWESFIPDRLDNKCPITWGLFTRGYFGATAAIQEKPPGTRCRLSWVDIALAGIEENTNLGVFYAGGTRGAFRQVMNKLIAVSKGSLSFDQKVNAATTIYGFKAQSRTLRTEDANQQSADTCHNSCGIESPDEDNIDRNFQLLLVGHGPATVRWIRPFAFLVPEDLSGDATACDDETGINAVRYDGAAVSEADYGDAVADLASKCVADYKAVKTEVLEQGGYESAGVGTAESIVSQAAADRVATIIAIRMAENDLSALQPPITSIGLVGDEFIPPSQPFPPSNPGGNGGGDADSNLPDDGDHDEDDTADEDNDGDDNGGGPVVPPNPPAVLFPALAWDSPSDIIHTEPPNTELVSTVQTVRSIHTVAQANMVAIGQPLLIDDFGTAAGLSTDAVTGTVKVTLAASTGQTSITIYVYDFNGPDVYLQQDIPADIAPGGTSLVSHPHSIPGVYSYPVLIPAGVQVQVNVFSQVGGGDISVGPLSGAMDLLVEFEPPVV